MNTKEIIRKFDIRLTKSLGQNFLTDERVVKRIADSADITGEDLVIEVGPGIGSMTVELAARAGRVIAIEIDKHLIPALRENFEGFTNIDLVNEDVMKADIKGIIDSACEKRPAGYRNVKVVANLPYYITTPIIMRFLEEDIRLQSMVFMVQKEVAERMTAKPGGKDYGALTVVVQYYSKPEKLFDVPPHSFIPQPDVDSTVIKLCVLETPPVKLINKDIFFKTVKAAFGQRRKTLLNALHNSGCFVEGKEQIKSILEGLNISPNRRGETLTITQFAELANIFCINNLHK